MVYTLPGDPWKCTIACVGCQNHLFTHKRFTIVGQLPQAFNPRQLGYVDGYVMYQWLGR